MPFDRKRYPKDWKAISASIRERSKGRCECEGECGLHKTTPGPRRCTERHGDPAKWAKGKVVLTVAHLGADRWTCPKCKAWFETSQQTPAFCQRCACWAEFRPGDKHDKMDCRPENLRAMCQRCHLRFDIAEHVENGRRTRRKKQLAKQPELFPCEQARRAGEVAP